MSLTQPREIPVPEPDLTPEQIVQRARDMVPVLRERQAETERLGRMTDQTSRDFIDAGFYRILQPRRFGGYEFDLPTFTRVALELSRGCPSSGWAYTLTAGHAHLFAALFGEQCQIDVCSPDGDVRIPGRFRPGKAERIEGGCRVSGTFDYVSGCDSATHFAFGFTFGDDVRPGELANDIIAIVDRADVEIIDNWDVMGLRGTGSKRCVVDGAEVPAHRTITSFFKPDAGPGLGRGLYENPLYRHGGIGGLVFSETASVAVGAARGMLDLFEEEIRTRRTSVLPLVPMTEHAQYPRFYGEALQLIEVAEAALLGSDQEYMTWCRRAAEEPEFEFTMRHDQLLQLRKQFCGKLAFDAVTLMQRVTGSAGMRTGATWNRYIRDMTVLMSHNTMQPELAADFYGRTHFGLLPHGAETMVPQVR
jgi:3-hydroxy-9,10-secoandrosta-1,3,5(10)-triene-9,17-dione monooxygenase